MFASSSALHWPMSAAISSGVGAPSPAASADMGGPAFDLRLIAGYPLWELKA